MNLFKELIKIVIAYTATFVTAVLPVIAVWALFLTKGDGTFFGYAACTIVSVPLAIFGIWFSTLVAGFFLNLWGKPWLENAGQEAEVDVNEEPRP